VGTARVAGAQADEADPEAVEKAAEAVFVWAADATKWQGVILAPAAPDIIGRDYVAGRGTRRAQPRAVVEAGAYNGRINAASTEFEEILRA
jgi:hypothetical protein